MNPLKLFQYNSPIILTFSFVSFLALLLHDFTDAQSTMLVFSVYRSAWSDPLTYVRVFTHVLGHANMAHFMNNFIMILLVGPMLEERYGHRWLILMMVITAFVTGVVHIITAPYTAQLGASGIVFMLILLSSFTNMQRGRIPLTLVLAVVIFIGREVQAATASTDTNIAYLAHIAGGVCGALFGFIANKR
jgi:membrane associated rhomboid family serine protease